MARSANSMTAPAKPPELQGTVAAGLVRGLLLFAIDCGAREDDLSAAAGVSRAELAEPDLRLPLGLYVRLTRAAKQLTGDPALSLKFGERVPMTELSALAFAARAPAVAADTLGLLNRFGRLVADVGPAGGERFRLERRDGGLWLCDMRPRPNAFTDLTESTFARMAANARRRGIDQPVSAVEVTHPAPAHAAEYDRVFEAPVRFSGSMNALRVDERMLATPSPRRPDYAEEVLALRAKGLLRRLDESSGVRAMVEAELSRSIPWTPLALDAVAARLGLSARTLARRLKAEGAGFEQVSDHVRLQRALRHLVDERCTISAVAYLTGFSDRFAFARAFKRWTGTTPGEAIARSDRPAP